MSESPYIKGPQKINISIDLIASPYICCRQVSGDLKQLNIVDKLMCPRHNDGVKEHRKAMLDIFANAQT